MATPTTTPAFVRIGARLFDFTNYAEVSTAYLATCSRLDLGSSKSPACTLLDANMNRVAYVSYNGKIWLGDERDWRTIGSHPCIYSPYVDQPLYVPGGA